MDVYARLKELGIELPPPPPPGGLYSPIKLFGTNMVYTSGVGPTAPDGSAVYSGKVGAELTLEQGQEAARLATLNLLSVLHAVDNRTFKGRRFTEANFSSFYIGVHNSAAVSAVTAGDIGFLFFRNF